MDSIRDLIEDARDREMDLIQRRDRWEQRLIKQIEATAPDCLGELDKRRAAKFMGDVVQAGFEALLRDAEAEIDRLDDPHFTPSARSLPAGSVSH